MVLGLIKYVFPGYVKLYILRQFIISSSKRGITSSIIEYHKQGTSQGISKWQRLREVQNYEIFQRNKIKIGRPSWVQLSCSYGFDQVKKETNN